MTEQDREKIARINELSAVSRTSWLAMLAYVGVTLLAVEDADFFVPSRQTQLPLVGISIPTFSFFVFAPPLGAALYIYLHIHLLKLWDALAAAPPRIDGEALSDRIHPWLVNDYFLMQRGDSSVSARPLLSLSYAASILLLWCAGPYVLLGFWWRSMPAHDERLTLFLGACLLVSLHAGFPSWRSAGGAARRRFRRSDAKPWTTPQQNVTRAILLVFVVGTINWLRTEQDDITLDSETPVIGRWLSEARKISLLAPIYLFRR